MAKALSTQTLRLNGVTLDSGSIDPSVAGFAANVGSVYLRDDGTPYEKIGAGDTDWRNLLANFTTLLSGRVPASGGGTVNFMRADGVWTQPVQSSPGWFGTGIDGVMTVNAGTTTWTRDMFHSNGTITSTGILDPAGYVGYFSDMLTVDLGGVIRRNGLAAAGATAGGALAAASLGASGAGSNGSVGTAGAPTALGSHPSPLPLVGATSGKGGTGGGNGVGGTVGGVLSNAAPSQGGPWQMPYVARMSYPQAVANLFPGGTGGAGGNGSAAQSGGGGGGGGGTISLVARAIVLNGTIEVIGGAGAIGQGANTGGGGGGGGGKIILTFQVMSGSGSVLVTGGVGGAGTGTFIAGLQGSDGYYLPFQV